jgi:hypothetical protein
MYGCIDELISNFGIQPVAKERRVDSPSRELERWIHPSKDSGS